MRSALLAKSGGNDALVVGARGEGLRQLVDRGLLQLTGGGATVDEAKARKAEISKKIRDGELR